ncbi:hypothetical protein GGR88_000116 [Sphingomonas jejuensis]|uniref:Uncharacterized protein n=1 Tax=Sphingomonas jejuensis TaxID=904715 RepID=A0ABX0XIJ9_9SPHN|nr:hypothetical protein [Sphingomonas jejuensis]NJC32642.1 hypothetical protein [Sphingomonas jejuensis]
MIAHRLQPIGWVAAVAVAALMFYLVSLRVATERAALDDTNRAIAAAERDIRRLGTELATRGSLHQLDRWNRQVLSLTSPKVDQYLQGQRQLAAFAIDAVPAAPAGGAQMMQASATAPAPSEPRLILAVVPDAARAPAPVIRTAAVAVAPPMPTLQKAAYTPTLLGSGTLDDLARRAEAEAGDR